MAWQWNLLMWKYQKNGRFFRPFFDVLAPMWNYRLGIISWMAVPAAESCTVAVPVGSVKEMNGETVVISCITEPEASSMVTVMGDEAFPASMV